MHRAIGIGLILVTLLVPWNAEAQLQNGDFELGGANWTPDNCPGWVFTFPATGGNPNGHAFIRSPFGNSAGTCCIAQTFLCGDPPTTATCDITFDFALDRIDASEATGRVEVFVDGVLAFVSPSPDHIPYTLGSITVPCGLHTIQLCLNVDAGNNGWGASFDNVRAQCVPPLGSAPGTWGAVKKLYD